MRADSLLVRVRRLGGRFVRVGAAAGILLAAVSLRSGQAPTLPKPSESTPPSSALNDKVTPDAPAPSANKKFDRETISDAAELCTLANQLRDELGKMNVNVFSLGVIEKTHAIERLARKIKGEAYARER